MTRHSRKIPTLARVASLSLLLVVAVSACGDGNEPASTVIPSEISGHENPLLAVWDTDFGVPPFDLIENDHYLPAFREAMTRHMAEIEAIVNNPEPPTFENTIVALDQAGRTLWPGGTGFRGRKRRPHQRHSQDVARDHGAGAGRPRRRHHPEPRTLGPGGCRVPADGRNWASIPSRTSSWRRPTRGSFEVAPPWTRPPRPGSWRSTAELAQLSTKFGENVLAETNAYELLVTD